MIVQFQFIVHRIKESVSPHRKCPIANKIIQHSLPCFLLSAQRSHIGSAIIFIQIERSAIQFIDSVDSHVRHMKKKRHNIPSAYQKQHMQMTACNLMQSAYDFRTRTTICLVRIAGHWIRSGSAKRCDIIGAGTFFPPPSPKNKKNTTSNG